MPRFTRIGARCCKKGQMLRCRMVSGWHRANCYCHTHRALPIRLGDMTASEHRCKWRLRSAAMFRSRGLKAGRVKGHRARGCAAATCIFNDQLRIRQLCKEELRTFHTHVAQMLRCQQIMCRKRDCRQRAYASGPYPSHCAGSLMLEHAAARMPRCSGVWCRSRTRPRVTARSQMGMHRTCSRKALRT